MDKAVAVTRKKGIGSADVGKIFQVYHLNSPGLCGSFHFTVAIQQPCEFPFAPIVIVLCTSVRICK